MARSRCARFTFLALLLVPPACSDSPTSADGACIAVVNVHGVFFAPTDGPGPAHASVSPDVFLTVTRNTGCLDQGEISDPLAHGESNYLPVGTSLHEIEGFGPDERLAVWSDVLEEWRVLTPMPAPSTRASTPSGVSVRRALGKSTRVDGRRIAGYLPLGLPIRGGGFTATCHSERDSERTESAAS